MHHLSASNVVQVGEVFLALIFPVLEPVHGLSVDDAREHRRVLAADSVKLALAGLLVQRPSRCEVAAVCDWVRVRLNLKSRFVLQHGAERERVAGLAAGGASGGDGVLLDDGAHLLEQHAVLELDFREALSLLLRFLCSYFQVFHLHRRRLGGVQLRVPRRLKLGCGFCLSKLLVVYVLRVI